ncbi:hypothetical protein OAQ60_01710 [Methylophilaceae bacterium]|nr:hypothetical protein [Methylophilaceae bacterium]
MNTKQYLTTFFAGVFSSNLVFAEIKPYFEGQINFYNPDEVQGSTALSLTSGSTTVSAGAVIENEYDTDTVGGVEFGFKLDKNSRVGFSYSKPDFELENIFLAVGVTLTDGGDTIGSAGASGTFSRAQLATVAPADTFDNEVKLYSLNYYYDFDSTTDIKPFLGVGIGLADIKNADDEELMYSFHGGARYFIADNTYVGAKASYSTIEGIKDGFGFTYEDIDLYSGSLVLGIEF